MNIWGFSSTNIVIYKTIRTFRPIKNIYSDNQRIFMSFNNNDLELFLWDHKLKELEIHHIDKTDDHNGKVNCIDSTKANYPEESLPSLEYSNIEDHPTPKGLFVTGGEDGYVKVW